MSLLAGDLLCFGLWLLLFATGTIVFIRRLTPLPIAEKERPLEPSIIRTNTVTARVLTENDFETRAGYIHTPNDGVVYFLPGDHLAIDGGGEWLITVQDMREQYRRIGLTESSGFAQYVFVGKPIEAYSGPDEPLRSEIAVWDAAQASA